MGMYIAELTLGGKRIIIADVAYPVLLEPFLYTPLLSDLYRYPGIDPSIQTPDDVYLVAWERGEVFLRPENHNVRRLLYTLDRPSLPWIEIDISRC